MAASHAVLTTRTPRLPEHFGLHLASIFIVVAVMGLVAAYCLDAVTTRAVDNPPLERGTPVDFTLAATELHVPSNWLRAPRAGGFTETIDLSIPLELAGQRDRIVASVALMSRARATPSAALLDTLYIHRFTPEQISGPRGLIGKPLLADAGYENETIWYDPVNANPFVAKCLTIDKARVDQPGCMRTVPLGQKISAVIRFDESVLTVWREFDAALAAELGSLL
jgi:hypothetical protein